MPPNIKAKDQTCGKRLKTQKNCASDFDNYPDTAKKKPRSSSPYLANDLEFARQDGKRLLECLAMPNHDRLPISTHKHPYSKYVALSRCNGRRMLTNKTVPVVRVIA